MKCSKHGELEDDDCYVWESGSRQRRACKICQRAKSKKQFGERAPRCTKLKDWTGQTFNELTFVRRTDERYRGAVLWELRCSCGTTIKRIAHFVVKGITKSCGCKTKALRADAGAKSRKLDPRISSGRSIWRRVYKDGCDFDTFLRLSQLPCTYCGVPPSRIYNKYDMDKRHPRRPEADFIYNGLDRLDNSKDHSPDNIVPCCTVCNLMKGTFSVSDFFKQVRKIYQQSCAEDRQDAGCRPA